MIFMELGSQRANSKIVLLEVVSFTLERVDTKLSIFKFKLITTTTHLH